MKCEILRRTRNSINDVLNLIGADGSRLRLECLGSKLLQAGQTAPSLRRILYFGRVCLGLLKRLVQLVPDSTFSRCQLFLCKGTLSEQFLGVDFLR